MSIISAKTLKTALNVADIALCVGSVAMMVVPIPGARVVAGAKAFSTIARVAKFAKPLTSAASAVFKTGKLASVGKTAASAAKLTKSFFKPGFTKVAKLFRRKATSKVALEVTEKKAVNMMSKKALAKSFPKETAALEAAKTAADAVTKTSKTSSKASLAGKAVNAVNTVATISMIDGFFDGDEKKKDKALQEDQAAAGMLGGTGVPFFIGLAMLLSAILGSSSAKKADELAEATRKAVDRPLSDAETAAVTDAAASGSAAPIISAIVSTQLREAGLLSKVTTQEVDEFASGAVTVADTAEAEFEIDYEAVKAVMKDTPEPQVSATSVGARFATDEDELPKMTASSSLPAGPAVHTMKSCLS